MKRAGVVLLVLLAFGFGVGILFFLIPAARAAVTKRISFCKAVPFDPARHLRCGVSVNLLQGGPLFPASIAFCVDPQSGEAFPSSTGFNLPVVPLAEGTPEASCSETLNT